MISHSLLSTLQDAGAVVVYNITDPLNPVYDSGAISELNDYTQQDGGVSSGEPEGLHYKDGFVFGSKYCRPRQSHYLKHLGLINN